jgi:hypothetical protein
MESRGIAIALPIHDLGTRRSWAVSTMPLSLYPQERPGTHCTGWWVGPRAGLNVCEKSRPHRDLIPGPSSQLLYRLSYRGPLKLSTVNHKHETVDMICDTMLTYLWLKLIDVPLSIFYVALCIATPSNQVFNPKQCVPCAMCLHKAYQSWYRTLSFRIKHFNSRYHLQYRPLHINYF